MLTSASSYKKKVIPGALYDDADTESIEANDLLTVTGAYWAFSGGGLEKTGAKMECLRQRVNTGIIRQIV